jgi:hypothetical protein
MKKHYEAPKFFKHGSVSNITAYTFDSNDGDIFFGITDATNQSGTGSLNACIQENGDCLNPNAK